MDAATNSNFQNSISFELLDDDFNIFPISNEEEQEIGIPSTICELLDSVKATEPVQKDPEVEAFQNDASKMRFKVVSEDELDALQDENNAQSTHWQTNWAVKVMRGNIKL